MEEQTDPSESENESAASRSASSSAVELAKVSIKTLPALLAVVFAYCVGDTFAEADLKRANVDKVKAEVAQAGFDLQKLRGSAMPRIGTWFDKNSSAIEDPLENSCFVTGSLVVQNLGQVPVEVSTIEVSAVEVSTELLPTFADRSSLNVSYGNLIAGEHADYARVDTHLMESFNIRLVPGAAASYAYAFVLPKSQGNLWGLHATVQASAVMCARSNESDIDPCFQDRSPLTLTQNYYRDFASTPLKARCGK